MTQLRALAFNLYFFGLTAILGIGGLVLRVAMRRRILGYAQYWAALMIAGARIICGIRVEITGAEHLPAAGPALLASQHQSAFDTLIWMTRLPTPSYVVKRELTRIPLFGPLLTPAGMIPVDRAARATALRSLLRATRRARDAGRQIIIFPEGTRVAPGEQVPLQPGIAAIATHLELPVIPIATDSGTRWGRRAFMKYPGTIHIAIGKPIPAGTPRMALLHAIEQFWRDSQLTPRPPVENSVGGLTGNLLQTLK
jgi:1-acyl-sn-glycerol-3-phosphate acyltransferase